MEMIDQMETNIFNNAITINGGISEHINNFWGGAQICISKTVYYRCLL